MEKKAQHSSQAPEVAWMNSVDTEELNKPVQLAREWLAKRANWLWWLVPLGFALGYWLLRPILIGTERQEYTTYSTLSTNIILMFAVWGYFNQPIWDRVYYKVRKRAAPGWFSWVMLVPMLVGLMYYLTLFGYETRW